MEMERSLSRNKTMDKLTLSDVHGVTLPKQFCHHLLLGIRRNKSLSEVNLNFTPQSWHCPDDGRLVYVSHILCDSVGCTVVYTELFGLVVPTGYMQSVISYQLSTW